MKKLNQNIAVIATAEFVKIMADAKTSAMNAMLAAIVAMAAAEDAAAAYKSMHDRLAKKYEPREWLTARAAATRNLRAARAIFNARAAAFIAAVKGSADLMSAMVAVKACLPEQANNPSRALAVYTANGQLKQPVGRNRGKPAAILGAAVATADDFDYDAATAALQALADKAAVKPFAKFFFSKMVELGQKGAKASRSKAA